MAGLVQASIHVREDADDRVLQDLGSIDVRAGGVTETSSLDSLESAFRLERSKPDGRVSFAASRGAEASAHLSGDHLILVAEFERKLVHERNVDRLEKLGEDDAAALAHEHLETSLSLLVLLHVQVREDGRGDRRVAEHLRDRCTRRFGDLPEKRLLVIENDAGNRVLARYAKEGLARLVEDLESCRESRRRREEGWAEDRKVRLDERIRLDATVRRDLSDLEFGEGLDEAVAVAEKAEQSSQRPALEQALRFSGPARRFRVSTNGRSSQLMLTLREIRRAEAQSPQERGSRGR